MNIIYIVIVSMVFVNIEVVTQLLHVEDLSDMFDNGDPFDIIYQNLKKAFDQVSHKRFAVKLESYAIPVNYLNGFLAFCKIHYSGKR